MATLKQTGGWNVPAPIQPIQGLKLCGKLSGCIISLYMKNKLLLCLFLPTLLAAQTYDLLIKGGHIIDPANQIDGISDIAISGNKVARLAPSIDTSQAKKTVDATGLYVTPGLVDLHAHVYG